MNRESLYLEIGGIDDDLILEAVQTPARKMRRIHIMRVVSAAACICLLCGAVIWSMHRDVVHIYAANAPIAAKQQVPIDEHTTVLTLREEELLAYYGVELPECLAGLRRVDATQYYLYQDEKSVIYDTNILRYRDDDGSRFMTVLLKKGSLETHAMPAAKKSRIDGISVMLAVDGSADQVYWAEFSLKNTSLQIVAHGMDQAQFVALIRELIYAQR